MFLLGDTSKGFTAGEDDLVLADGRVIGPVESDRAKEQLGWWFRNKATRLVTAREIFEGSVCGDDYHLVRTDEMSLETQPFVTIYDIWVKDDNGRVVFETPRGFSAVDPERLILVDNPELSAPTKKLPSPQPVPEWFDIEHFIKPDFAVPSQHHGEIAVFAREFGYQVGWRQDGRQSKDIVGLSRHNHLKTAIQAAEFRAVDYHPRFKKKQNRPKDVQRDRLYMWEHSFHTSFEEFADVRLAQELASEICSDVGCAAPTVSLGHPNLTTHSYYRAGRVVLSVGMVTNHTLVHEVAHHLVRALRLEKEASHGPHFAGVLLALLSEYMSADRDEALFRARQRDVVVNLDTMNMVLNRIAERKLSSSGPTI